MRRRQILRALGGVAGLWSFAAHSQQLTKLPTVGFLGSSTSTAWRPWLAAFVQRLRDLGWIEGRTVAIEVRWAEGQSENFAEIAAEFAIALGSGEELPQDKVSEEVNNGKADVPSAILEPVAVTKDNIKDTVIKDGFVEASELCTGPYAADCKEAGISG